MNILLIHNNYGAYSGEEMVVDQQTALFRSLGHDVFVYRKTSESGRGTWSGNIRGFFLGFYSPGSVKDIKRIIRQDRPDVAVVHNLYPYISPAILKPLKDAGIPVVMTVHNYRLMCPTGLFMRNYRPCELCLEKGNEWSCIRYNCEHSFLKSIGYAGRNWYARVTKAYLNHVDVFACITKFQVEKLVEAGFNPASMRLIPNFINIIKDDFESGTGNYVAISGRLSEEKGIDLILEVASETPGIRYVFAGSPRAGYSIRKPVPDNCIFRGYLSPTELAGFYGNARFLLNASRCYEGFPMTILEAASHKKPSIGPGHAGFLEIIDPGVTGFHFLPGNTQDLKEKIEFLWNNPEKGMEMGKHAFEKLKTNYSAESVGREWKKLFEEITLKNL